jgi:HD-GYP domain-containing protein (c-di-GMP phosphodiesterase class II)
VPIDQVTPGALRDLPIYLQTRTGESRQFALYCAQSARFTEGHRARLQQAGVKFIYLPMSCQGQFRMQMEEDLVRVAEDPAVAVRRKSEMVYETSLELINEVLTDEAVGKNLPRLGQVSRAVSRLVVKDRSAFSHLFATAQHDFYTATHMVNVGTWMTSLAYAAGMQDEAELEQLCTAGMVHDVGKTRVPSEVLNKVGLLTDAEWALLRAHPEHGAAHLRQQGVTDDIVLRVTLEHHERIDGTGYPRGLKGEQISRASRICAVVDSFDAMTACRPFKNRVKSIAEAMAVLRAEAGKTYDADLVEAWGGLLQRAADDKIIREPLEVEQGAGRRREQRFGLDCPLLVMTLEQGTWAQKNRFEGKAHNISLSGLGMLVPAKMPMGTYVRVVLRGKGKLKDRQLEGQVVHCRSYTDGWSEVGVRLCGAGVQELASAAVMAAK